MRFRCNPAVAAICLAVTTAFSGCAMSQTGRDDTARTGVAELAEDQPAGEGPGPFPEAASNDVVGPDEVQRPAERIKPPESPQAGDVWVNPKDEMEMVFVPAGEFIMGTSDAQIGRLLEEHPDWNREWFADERPQRRLYLDAFWIDKTEVTVGQYQSFCGATGGSMPDAPSWGWQESHPIVNVTWQGASAYAEWAGKRLPTEAEWEKAARGEDAREYPWGNEEPDHTRCNMVGGKDGHSSVAPVGSFPQGASPYGCLDMAGNVSEWCADWYDSNYYKEGPTRNPKGPDSGQTWMLRAGSWEVTHRVLRGGSWDDDGPRVFRAAGRSGFIPDLCFFSWYADADVGTHFGFRCVRDAE